MICPVCASGNPDGASFCLACGTRLESPGGVQGERKLVTALFADVVDSTAMAERLDPEHFTEVMNGAIAFMSASAARYGGTVAGLLGDAVVAFFGAPVAHEDDAERAVRAGLMIRDRAREYAREVGPRYGVEFHVRVGINTGLVVAGEIGSETRTEYTAMGDTTNVAARLQGLTEPDTILASASTHRLVRGLFEFAPRTNLALKGRSVPLDAYVVLGPAQGAGQARGIEGMRSPVVGRDEELGLLRMRLASLREGRGAYVSIVGEVGLGKSRLLEEARSTQASGGSRWLEGRAVSFGGSTPYAPWRQVIREALGAREGEPPEPARARLRSEAGRRGVADAHLPYIETLLGIATPADVAAATALEGEVLVGRITDAVRELCRALAAEAPTVLVFEDLHWADNASLDLIVAVADVSRSTPLLVLCTLRPEKGTASWRFLERVRDHLAGDHTELTLLALSPQQSRNLLSNLLEVEGLPAEFREEVLQKSEGNPFFLEEVLRSLVDAGHIVRANGGWKAVREISAVAVPDTLVGVLSARIDHLPEDTKRVAQTAAVLGRVFAGRLLEAVCAAAPEPERVADVGPHLEILEHEELIRARAHQPEPEYSFKHALTQQAAYDLLLVRRRRAIHRRVAGVLETLHPEGDALAPLLAHHYLLAEEWEQASAFSRRAGELALQVYALNEALGHFRRTVHAAERLAAADPGPLMDAVLEWTFVAYALRLHQRAADREEILERLRHVARLARERNDDTRLGRALIWQGNLYMLAGFPTESFPLLREGYEIAVKTGDEALALLPLFTMTWFMVDSDPRGARPRLRKVIADARRFSRQPGARELEAHALAILGLAHARLGEFDEAEAAIREALTLAPHTRSPIKEADVDLTAAMAYYEMGDIERGLQYSNTGTAHAKSVGGMECVCTGTFLLGYGNLQMRRLEEALHAFEASFEIVRPLGPGMQGEKTRIQASLAFTRFSAGATEALAELEATLEKARAFKDDFALAYVSQMLGEAYAEVGAYEPSRDRYAAALEYYRSQAMLPSVARVLHAMAGLYHRQGESEQAQRTHAEAKAITDELQARRSAAHPVDAHPHP
jgi:class 3 adenylate cyclase/tetratricopeptide (TPR) repeat protein